jgi:hypothetical protein
MGNSNTPARKDFSKQIVKIIVAIVIAILVVAMMLDLVIPKLQQGIPTESTPPQSSAYFEFPSESTYRTSEGGFLGIGANVVVWVQVVVKNTGTAAGGCTVNVEVTDENSGSYWTQSQGVYLQVGQNQTLSFKFASGPHNDAYDWTVWSS